MTEESTATEEVAEDPVDDQESRIEEANDLLTASLGDDDDDPGEDSDVEDEEAAEETEEPEEEKEAEEETEEEKEPDPKDGTVAKVMQAKRYRRQASRRLDEAQKIEGQVKKREETVNDREKLLDSWATKLRSDPVAAIDDLASRVGISSTQLYAQMTKRHLSGGPDVSDVQAELQRLRKEIEDKDTRRIEDERAAVKKIRFDTVEQAISRDVNTIAGLGSDSQYKEKYPFLSAMDPREAAIQADTVIRTVLDSGTRMSLEQVAGFIDTESRTRYESTHRAIGPRDDDPPQGNNGSGISPRAQKRGIAGKTRKPRAVTNGHAANSSGATRELSHAERLAKADEALRGLVPIID